MTARRGPRSPRRCCCGRRAAVGATPELADEVAANAADLEAPAAGRDAVRASAAGGRAARRASATSTAPTRCSVERAAAVRRRVVAPAVGAPGPGPHRVARGERADARGGPSTSASASSRAPGRRSAPSSCAPTPPPTATGWPASASGWRSRTVGRGSCWPSSRRRAAPCRCCRPPGRPTTTCSPSCWPGCGSSTAQQRAVGDGGRRATTSSTPSAPVLERRIRSHVRRAPAGDTRADVPLAESLRLLGERALVEYANLDGRLHAVSVVDNRASLHELGPIDGLVRRHRRLQPRPPPAQPGPGVGGVAGRRRNVARRAHRGAGRAPRAAAGVALGRPVVIVPTGVLHALPWGALPGLTGRAVSVCPVPDGMGDRPPRRDDPPAPSG